MEEALRGFLRSLREERHMAENTLLSYERDLKKLFAWFRQEGISSLSTVSELRLNSYLLWLEREGFSPATINRAAASIRAFFAYETAAGHLEASPAEGLRRPRQERRDPYVLEEEEIRSFLRETEGSSAKQLRDRAMLGLLCATGLRVSELIALKTEDVDVQIGYVRQQSRGQERVVSFDEELRLALCSYLESGRPLLLKEAEEEHLFFNLSGGALSRQGVWKMIRAYGQKAGIAGEVTPQSLKNSYAVHRLLRESRAVKQGAVRQRSGGRR